MDGILELREKLDNGSVTPEELLNNSIDLAKQYQCANDTKSINLAVKRNRERFPSDFYFQLK